jgi:UDP:flavonoid glycosyltransferase YjiC (YdhE family)
LFSTVLADRNSALATSLLDRPRGPFQRLRAAAIAGAVRAVLAGPGYRTAAAGIARVMASGRTEDRAVAEIEQLLAPQLALAA